jgi:hypothetical protein
MGGESVNSKWLLVALIAVGSVLTAAAFVLSTGWHW